MRNARILKDLYKSISISPDSVDFKNKLFYFQTATDGYRRGFDKGFSSGCTSIAKEIFQAFRDPQKIDMNIVLEVLYRNMAVPREERLTVDTKAGFSADTLAAVELFQQVSV